MNRCGLTQAAAVRLYVTADEQCYCLNTGGRDGRMDSRVIQPRTAKNKYYNSIFPFTFTNSKTVAVPLGRGIAEIYSEAEAASIEVNGWVYSH